MATFQLFFSVGTGQHTCTSISSEKQRGFKKVMSLIWNKSCFPTVNAGRKWSRTTLEIPFL